MSDIWIGTAAEAEAKAKAPSFSYTGRWWRRYGLATVGAAIVGVWVLVAIFAPLLAPYDPNDVNVVVRLQPPSGDHWLGTDSLGRDGLSRLIFGARISLFSGLAVVLIAGTFGSLIGGIAAYAGGWIEEALMRCTDLVLCFPPIVLAMAIGAALGIGTLNTIIAILVVSWPQFARLGRGLVLMQRSHEYVEAAVVAGYGPGRILFRHIVPNVIGPVIVLVTLNVGNAINMFAGLSFLGLGAIPPAADWGAMISEGRELVEQWWVAIFPGLAILSIVIGFNFVGDALRDWLDPKTEQR